MDGTEREVYVVGVRYVALIMALNGQPLTKFARNIIFAGWNS